MRKIRIILETEVSDKMAKTIEEKGMSICELTGSLKNVENSKKPVKVLYAYFVDKEEPHDRT